MDIPQTKYAKTADGAHIGYQVLGEGPIDIIYTAGWFLNIGYAWEVPEVASFFRWLASFARLIVFDRRGTGLSDRMIGEELPILEVRMDDIRAVMDAAGSRKAAIFGSDADGGMLCALFAASPERSLALILYGTAARCL